MVIEVLPLYDKDGLKMIHTWFKSCSEINCVQLISLEFLISIFMVYYCRQCPLNNNLKKETERASNLLYEPVHRSHMQTKFVGNTEK